MLEDNKAIVRRFIAALGKGDVAELDATMADGIEAICTSTGILAGTRGRDEILRAAGMLGQITRNGLDFKILQLTAEDDRVSCEVQGAAILVTGQPCNNQYHFLSFLKDSKIVRMTEYMDSLLVETVLGPIIRGASEQPTV